VSVSGSRWRHSPSGADPLFLASPPSSGRWQRGGVAAAVYLADEKATAWAEWYRVLAEIALPPTYGMPRDLWRWTVAVDDIAESRNTSEACEARPPHP
jgi:RES domain-containing protein